MRDKYPSIDGSFFEVNETFTLKRVLQSPIEGILQHLCQELHMALTSRQHTPNNYFLMPVHVPVKLPKALKASIWNRIEQIWKK